MSKEDRHKAGRVLISLGDLKDLFMKEAAEAKLPLATYLRVWITKRLEADASRAR